MNSMTGYAWRERACDGASVSVEIKGCNSRFLDISVSAPPWLSRMEARVREIVGGACGRGRVDVSIRVRETDSQVAVRVNSAAAAAYAKAISDLADALGLTGKASVSTLIGMDGVLETEKERDAGKAWAAVEPALREAVADFAEERAREGKHTELDILASVARVEAGLRTVESRAPGLEAAIMGNIRARLKELGAPGADENRVLAETAALLIKHSVSEEVSRLKSHLGEFQAEAARNPKPGKKLDFLCQEISREINTIASKSATIDVSRAVVEMKEALESAREQLRNVE